MAKVKIAEITRFTRVWCATSSERDRVIELCKAHGLRDSPSDRGSYESYPNVIIYPELNKFYVDIPILPQDYLCSIIISSEQVE